MMWETAGVIAEIVGAIAVVISLLYLAIQLKQNTDLARAYDLAAENWHEMSDEDARAYIWFVAKSFHILEGMFRQHQRGLLTNEVWEPYQRYIFGVLQIEAVSGWWRSDGSLTSREFQEHVETLLLSPPESSWRQVSTAEMVPDKN